MARARSTFRQRDVTAALKAARAGGLKVARIEVRQDGVTIIAGDENNDPKAAQQDDPETAKAKEHLRHVIDKLQKAQKGRT